MKNKGRRNRNLSRSNQMVSEIIGTVLLLAITVAIFSTIYSFVISYPSPSSPTLVQIVGSVEGENIILEHRGGEAISLDSKLKIDLGDVIDEIVIGDNNYLEDKYKEDGLWNIGEKIRYPFEYNEGIVEAKIIATDEKTNSLVMLGSVDITPQCDIGLKQTVSDKFPLVGDEINLTTTVDIYRSDLLESNVTINNKLPMGLLYENHSSTAGIYDPDTGLWVINEQEIDDMIQMNITATVTSSGTSEFTQLAMLLDGSSSISDSDWEIMCMGLADAIENPVYFPQDGAVELTIIQFGTDYTHRAKLELGPIVVNSGNINNIVKEIRYNMTKMGGQTPMSCAINLACDILYASPNYKSDRRQIINLVTDGNPNCICEPGTGIYTGISLSGKNIEAKAKQNTVDSRNYLINKLNMNSSQDEFDCEAVGDEPHIDWLKNKIVWPGNYIWEDGYDFPPGPGWVRKVDSYQEFADSIFELFLVLFRDISYTVEIIDTDPVDVNFDNNNCMVVINP